MEQIKLLRRLGLTEYEARAYFSLSKLGPSTVREIVLDSNLPRNKAYEALQRLEQKNKVISLPVSPRKYKISNPEVFKEEIKELNESVDLLIKLAEQPKTAEFKDLFWIIKGKKAIEEKLSLQNMKVKREIVGCNQLSKVLYKNLKTMKEAVDRGVTIKLICTFDKEKISIYKEWMKTGAKIRVFNQKQFGPLLPRITVFDGEIARLTVGKPEVIKEEDYLTLWTESKAFSQMLKKHFMSMWKHSKPLEKRVRI